MTDKKYCWNNAHVQFTVTRYLLQTVEKPRHAKFIQSTSHKNNINMSSVNIKGKLLKNYKQKSRQMSVEVIMEVHVFLDLNYIT